jgi:gliding motility-associated-like protein
MFSPNKDGKNDVFKVYGFGVASIEVKIWDRLGNLIYETNRVEDIVEEAESANSVPGWDGKYKGKELGQDTYIWNVKGKLKNGEDLKANGGKNSGPVIIMN